MKYAAVLASLVLTACSSSYLYWPKLAQQDATVMVRCSDDEKGSQLIVILLDHTKDMSTEEVQRKRHLQKIAEIEVDSECHFTVRAPKTPLQLSTDP